MGHHPMGHLGAPASFQRLIHRLPNVIVSIDDLLLHSTNHEEHLGQLKVLLAWLWQHSIKIYLPKCELASKEVAYLGFSLTKSGILPRADKLQEFEKLPLPQLFNKSDSFWASVTSSRTISVTLPR